MTNEELATEIRAGRAGYGELWERVHRFVRQQAHRYYTLHAGTCVHAGVEQDDLVQCGFLALQDAVQAFDPARGYTLLAYLRYPLSNRFREACGLRTRRRDPLNLCTSLDKPAGEEGDAVLSDFLPNPDAAERMEEVVEEEYRRQLRDALDMAIDMLDEKRRDTIRRRFWNGETQDAIAADMHVGRERIRQTEQAALRDLRCGPRLRLLKPFVEERCTEYAWKGTGWAAWNSTGASSVERAVEKTDELIRRIQEQRERETDNLCALLHITREELEAGMKGGDST